MVRGDRLAVRNNIAEHNRPLERCRHRSRCSSITDIRIAIRQLNQELNVRDWRDIRVDGVHRLGAGDVDIAERHRSDDAGIVRRAVGRILIDSNRRLRFFNRDVAEGDVLDRAWRPVELSNQERLPGVVDDGVVVEENIGDAIRVSGGIIGFSDHQRVGYAEVVPIW